MNGFRIKICLFLSIVIVFIFSITTMNLFASSTVGDFSVLTYNVAGLPEILSSGNPSVNTVKISPLLNNYSIAAVQEDFAYHNDLIKYVTHPYLTTTSGNVPSGDGMNFMSKYPFCDFDRVTWNKRYGLIDSGSDQLTPKGFMYAQYKIEPGVYIDVYTLHTDAGDDSGSYEARRDNISQIASYINANSSGNAVIVLGDTNSRYTRSNDNFETDLLNACNLKDPWIDLVRGGSIPSDGTALQDDSNRNGPNFEVVDKVFYRSSKSVTLKATSYKLEDSKFVDENKNQLSDHFPVSVNFQYIKSSDVSLSDLFGGSGGTAFNYLQNLPKSNLSKLSIKSGERLDAVSMTYSDNSTLSSGGNGGTEKIINMSKDEYITQLNLCKGTKSGTSSPRIFYAEFKTNKGQVLSGGTKTNESMTLTAPTGWYIAGLFGRAADEVDKLGVIYKPITN